MSTKKRDMLCPLCLEEMVYDRDVCCYYCPNAFESRGCLVKGLFTEKELDLWQETIEVAEQ